MRVSLRRLSYLIAFLPAAADARVVQIRIDHREPVLHGKSFGAVGAYEKLTGTIEFALNPSLPQNAGIVDLGLAPRSSLGEVEFSADFYLLKPADVSRGNGRLLYEVGNRGSKGMLRTFQKGGPSQDPTTQSDFGDGLLMRQGYSLLWMGWQWDVPDGRMRMNMPIASDHGAPITGLVRGNFILDARSGTAPLADRGHKSYPVADAKSADAFMTVRDATIAPPQRIPREKWHFVDDSTVALEGGFEPGRIYDVVYRARDPRVVGTGLVGTRDLISFLKYSDAGNPLRGIRFAYGWGVSQSGRLLRHFLYEGFNEDEQGRQVFDGVIDEVGGAGRGSFNHRFAQASRDAEEFFNFLYPADMFPFTDGPETDPETGQTDALLAKAEARHVAPKLFHILSNSEYFNRSGSLVHTDPAGHRDLEPPAGTRIYVIASGPHFFGAFPTEQAANLAAPLNPINRNLVVRALLQALDAWVTEGIAPPPSQLPHISDGTLTTREKAGWPKSPFPTAGLDNLPAGLRSEVARWHRRFRAAAYRQAVCLTRSRRGRKWQCAGGHPAACGGRSDCYLQRMELSGAWNRRNRSIRGRSGLVFSVRSQPRGTGSAGGFTVVHRRALREPRSVCRKSSFSGAKVGRESLPAAGRCSRRDRFCSSPIRLGRTP